MEHGDAAHGSADRNHDDARLVGRRQAGHDLPCKSAARDREAADRFKTLTEGPIVVHSSKDPFLEWDALNRVNRRRTLASVDVASGDVKVLLPERALASHTVARDGTFITFMEDVTDKTDYDTIGGTSSALRLVRPTARCGRSPRRRT